MTAPRLLLAAGLFAVFLPLYLRHHGQPFDNGDEAIYAEMAREMARTGHVLTLRWQDRPVLNRPPAAVWPLALACRLFGPTERAIRFPLALEATAGVVLLFLWGARRYGTAVGLCAALLLGTTSLWFLFARYIQSEPLLVALVLLAGLAWEKGRDQPRWLLAFGGCLGLALLTKQLVGALPLVFPALDLAAGRRLPRRALALALGLAAALTVPWLVYELFRHGHAFVEAFLWRTVVGRATRPLHESTTALFYPVEIWRREGPLVLVAALGLGYCVWRRDPLPLGWTVAALVPLSLSASRYPHYALLAYPPLAMAAARVSVELGRTLLAAPLTLVWALLHLGPAWQHPPGSIDPQSGQLARRVAEVSRPDDLLLVIDQAPYAARFYADRRTIELVFDAAKYEDSTYIMPAEIALVDDVARFVASAPRWFAITPRQRAFRLKSLGTVYLVAASPAYVLVTNVRGPEENRAPP